MMQRDRSHWVWASLAALGMNLALFLMMPHLLRATPARPVFDTLLPGIQMVRLKRPDSPVTHQPRRQPEPEKQHRTPQPSLNTTASHRPMWPLEINPRLPAGPGTLALPPVAAGLQDLGLDDLFGVGDLDQPLMTLTRIPPVYPLSAKRRGIEGWVTVRFVINEQGSVENATIVEAHPPDVFGASVLSCVSGWRFKPGTVEGQPVRVWADTTIHFTLD